MFRTSDISLDQFTIRRQCPTGIDDLAFSASSWATGHQPDLVQPTDQQFSPAVMRRCRGFTLLPETLTSNVFQATAMEHTF